MIDRHVLFLPSWYPTNRRPVQGIFFQDQAQSLATAGNKVGVVAVDVIPWRGRRVWTEVSSVLRDTDEVEGGVRILRRSQLNVLPRRWRAARWVRSTISLAEAYRRRYGLPDVVHAQSAVWGGYAGLHLARRWRRPLVITEHSTAFARGLIARWELPWIRESCALPTRVVAVSPALAKSLAGIVEGLEPAIVPNLVDTDFFRLPTTPASRPVDVLYVGRLVKKKGVDLLLRAVAELVGRGSPIHTRVIGDGPERNALEKLSTSLGLVSRVCFTGTADRNGVREAMWRSRIFVLPSRVETFGLVLAEAMACGLPVVATVSGGPESFVRPPYGWLTPVEDHKALATAIANALGSDQEAVTRSAREYAVSQFGPAAFYRRIEGVYAGAQPH